jgi:hypothetical protein
MPYHIGATRILLFDVETAAGGIFAETQFIERNAHAVGDGFAVPLNRLRFVGERQISNCNRLIFLWNFVKWYRL